ncbi:MAG TPA: hypothetical protein VIS56_02515 [Candidatus Saccharimonadales bacterium]
MNETIFYNGLGVIGASLLLFGFYRINSGKWSNRSFWYEFDNMLGAFLIIVYQIHYHAYVTVVVNLVWAGVAATGLVVFSAAHMPGIKNVST